MTMSDDSTIRVRPCPKCPLCETDGLPLYRDLKDRLFGVQGTWSLSQCLNPDCKAIWLNPMPVEQDLPKAYRTYYTHQTQTHSDDNLARRLYSKAKRGYLASRYGYYSDEVSRMDRVMGKAFFLHPGRRAKVDFEVFYLNSHKGGRLLEIGCGSGAMLKSMVERGWQAEGLDFDPAAVANARQKGLTVHLGSMGDQNFSAGSFDAIVMSHVIEHVPAPRTLLQECHRVLKPGGRLVMITPNTESLGHHLFGANWRGLEPPRHLHLFNLMAAKKLVTSCGFKSASVTTTVRCANEIFIASRSVAETGGYRMGDMRTKSIQLWALSMQLWEWFLLRSRPNVGEELVIFARKQ